MDHNEVLTLMDEIKAATGAEYAYDHFAEGEAPDPPFICFLYPGTDNFAADNTVYYSERELNIELYTDYKNPDLEEALEEILTFYELYFEKSEVWITSERMYEVLYVMAV